MVEGMGVVVEARPPWQLLRTQATPGCVVALQAEYLEAGAAQIRLQHQTVVPGAKDDAVVFGIELHQAEAPEYCFTPNRQNQREPTSMTAARATAPYRKPSDSRPTMASDGTVTAKATGTRKVSAVRSHPG